MQLFAQAGTAQTSASAPWAAFPGLPPCLQLPELGPRKKPMCPGPWAARLLRSHSQPPLPCLALSCQALVQLQECSGPTAAALGAGLNHALLQWCGHDLTSPGYNSAVINSSLLPHWDGRNFLYFSFPWNRTPSELNSWNILVCTQYKCAYLQPWAWEALSLSVCICWLKYFPRKQQ